MWWFLVLAGAGLALVAVSVAAAWRLARRRGWRAGIWLLLLRLGTLVLLALLLGQVFWLGRQPPPEDARGKERPPQLAVLEDASLSMRFQADLTHPRQMLAATVLKDVEQLRAELAPKAEIQRFLFGSNVVPAAAADRLNPGSTQTAAAVARTLARQQVDALLVISDGAASDGPVPGWLLDWAGNRGIGLYTVCTTLGPNAGFDYAVRETRCARSNPDTVRAVVVCTGQNPAKLEVTLQVDEELAAKRVLGPQPAQEVTFPLPPLANGWHEYAVSITPATGELTAVNNVQRGVFQVAPPSRILFLYGTPRRENLQLARLLNTLYPDRVTTLDARDPETKALNLRDYVVCVLGDVQTDAVPEPVTTALHEQTITAMLLFGRAFPRWDRQLLPALPAFSAGLLRNLAEEKDTPASVLVAKDNHDPAFKYLETGSLGLDLFYQVTPGAGAATVLTVQTRQGTAPLVVTDRLDRPRAVVVLTDATWKWGLHPDTRVRSEYRAFWSSLFGWLIGEGGSRFDLTLEFERDPTESNRTRIRVAPVAELPVTELVHAELQRQYRGETAKLPLVAAENSLHTDFTHPPERPIVVWFQAAAGWRDQVLQSQRKPLLLESESLELLATAPQPERLAELTAGRPERSALFPEREPVLRRLWTGLHQDQPPPRRPRRNPSRELTLAAMIVLLLGCEWLVERNLSDRPRPR